LKRNFDLDTHQENFQIFSEIPDFEIIGEGNYQISPKDLKNSQIIGEGSYQTSPEDLKAFPILGGGNYQISPEDLKNFQILGGGNYQTSPENLRNLKITERSFQTSLVNSTPVDRKGERNKTSLRDTTLFYLKESKKKNSSPLFKGIKFSR